MSKRIMWFLLVFVTLLPLSVQAQEGVTIADIVTLNVEAEQPEFTIFQQVVQSAEPTLNIWFSDPAVKITVFAPTDVAFNTYFEQTATSLEAFLGNPFLLNSVLANHVVPAVLDSTALTSLGAQNAFAGTGLENSLLVFSHNADVTQVNGANLVAIDLAASNGVLHVVDHVLSPSEDLSAAVALSASETDEPEIALGTLTELVGQSAVAETPEFVILNDAIEVSDGILRDALNATPPLTLFAPTDSAFVSLLAAMSLSDADLVADVPLVNTLVAYHIVPGRFSLSTLMNLASSSADGIRLATTLPGQTLWVSSLSGTPVINGYVNLVGADVQASNGVMNVIDAVLTPSNE